MNPTRSARATVLPLRSLLLVPGNDAHRFDAALESGADAVVLDLAPTDPVAATAARANAPAFLARAGALPVRPRLVVRIHALSTGLVDPDLDAVMAGCSGAGCPDTVVLPGAVGAVDIQHLAAKLAVREAECGLASGATRIIALGADTARGVLALHAVPGASPRLLGLGWNPAGLAAGTGAEAAQGAAWCRAGPCRVARALTVLTAAAAGVAAIDAAHRGTGDGAALARACRAARRDGFSGKMAVDPAEVATINSLFAPTPNPGCTFSERSQPVPG